MEGLAFSPGSPSQQLGSACELSPRLGKARLQVSLTYKGRVALARSRKPPGLGKNRRRIIRFWPRQRQGWLVWDRNAARKLTPTLQPRPHRTKSVPQAQGRVTEPTSGALGLGGFALPSPDLTQIVSARPTDSHQPGRSDTIKSLRANSSASCGRGSGELAPVGLEEGRGLSPGPSQRGQLMPRGVEGAEGEGRVRHWIRPRDSQARQARHMDLWNP